jgi:hypothetical protein
MAENRFVFNGLEELKAALRTLPAELTNEGGVITQQHAYAGAAAVRAEYEKHRRAGELADHVTVQSLAGGPLGVGLVVKSAGKDAWLFEHGSQARHTAIGANRGSMPATPTFIPIMMRFRRAMYLALADLLRRHGLVVTGQVESADVAA